MRPGRDEEDADEKLEASRDWFLRFKRKRHFYNIKVQGEAASTKVVAASSYPEDLAKVIKKHGLTKQPVFNVDETAFYWKKCCLGLS